MASTGKKNDDEVNTWDSDVEVSSDDTDNDTDNKQNESQESQSNTKIKPPSQIAPPPNDNDDNKTEQKIPDEPIHLKLALFDNYNQSQMYAKIRKRRIQKKTNNDSDTDNDDNKNNENEEKTIEKKEKKEKKKVTINDLRSNRILYEMNNYEYKWFWIDSLPTDDSNDYIWIQQYANINLFPSQQQETKGILFNNIHNEMMCILCMKLYK